MSEEYETKGNVGCLAFFLIALILLSNVIHRKQLDKLEQRIQKLEQVVGVK